MAEFASKGVAGTGLGLGIAGTALGLLNGGSSLLTNGLVGANGCGNCMNKTNCGNCGNCGSVYHCPVTQHESEMQGRIAELEGQKYTDAAIITAYKDTYAQFTAQDNKIANVVKDTTGALIETGQAVARLNEQVACLKEQLNSKFDFTNQKMDYEIKAARTEAANMVAMEGERRACGDEKLLAYVNGHFIPGTLKLPEREICYGRYVATLEENPCCGGGTTTPTTGA